MLEVAGLQVAYGQTLAVRDVSLRVGAGEVVAVIGPNGAGKSTTIAAIFGLVTPRCGSILFDGESLIGLSPDRIARRGLALIPEGRSIFTTLSVADNLILGAVARRDRSTQDAARDGVLNRFPVLGKLYHTPAGKLSGGEQQQLAIARALLAAPRLLILDEPSLGLAPQLVDLVFETIAGLRDDGVTVLVVEQNAARAAALADRTYILSNGLVSAHGAREEMRDADYASAYLGEAR
jgi:branched-chain amino acid transport system ATP-binding protein